MRYAPRADILLVQVKRFLVILSPYWSTGALGEKTVSPAQVYSPGWPPTTSTPLP